jgi:cyclomaltodextrinase / maltogenic alpha-amylase / neopullulanase
MEKTSIKLRSLVFYQVFVRNHSQQGDFQAVIGDLDRIAALGVDVLYLLPIHPIGVLQRKGTMGSPYSIQDYRAISPDLGDFAMFSKLIEATHRHGMKLMMDVVFNHTSRDSALLQNTSRMVLQKRRTGRLPTASANGGTSPIWIIPKTKRYGSNSPTS